MTSQLGLDKYPDEIGHHNIRMAGGCWYTYLLWADPEAPPVACARACMWKVKAIVGKMFGTLILMWIKTDVKSCFYGQCHPFNSPICEFDLTDV